MYFEGDFCMSNNSQLAGAVNLIVRGKTTVASPQNAIGTAGVPLASNLHLSSPPRTSRPRRPTTASHRPGVSSGFPGAPASSRSTAPSTLTALVR